MIGKVAITVAPLTKPQQRALAFVRSHGPITPAALARLMWPESIAWRRTSHRHDGISGAHGAGLIMAAGALLWRLYAARVAWKVDDYRWEAR